MQFLIPRDGTIFRCSISLAFCLLAVASGCTPKSEPTSGSAETTTSERKSDRDRPPLRILMVDQPVEMQEVLRRRWAGVTEQALEFETSTAEMICSAQPPQFDLVFAPAYLIGTLVERELVSPLPEAIADYELSRRTADQNLADSGPRLPPLWKLSANYGKEAYALPLGCSLILPSLADGAPGSRQIELPVALNASQTLPALYVNWEQHRVIAANDGVKTQNGESVEYVDIFLAIACTQRPQSYEPSLLFNLVDFSPRLVEDWMLNSARLFKKVMSASPDDDRSLLRVGWAALNKFESSSTDAAPNEIEPDFIWHVPLYQSQLSSTSQEESNDDSQKNNWKPVTTLELSVVDSGRAPAVFLGSRTRQTSKSILFLRWANESSQRTALSATSPWIPRDLIFQSNAVSDSQDTAENLMEYRKLVKEISLRSNVQQCFRVHQGHLYRQELNTALTDILALPDDARIPARMQQCLNSWLTITNSIGREAQQDSLEKTLGLRD